ncbi:MAG: choice-of-anchor J domain-containing protein, partial [Candidatus Cloacimonadales bacterium]|nr:choice-of-anchor J domain-containing protein [Candidatus Cloacimonadales bacterium]
MKKTFFLISLLIACSLLLATPAKSRVEKFNSILTNKSIGHTITKSSDQKRILTITNFPWNESFDGSDFPEGWTTLDLDNDGETWYHYDDEPDEAHSGIGWVGSYSWDPGYECAPDNWLITPMISLPSTHEAELSYWITPIFLDEPHDTYSIMISTTDNDADSFSTLFTEVVNYEPWTQKFIDLSDYAGENIYIAFRHHNSVDAWMVCLDDVKIELGDPIEINTLYPPQDLTAEAVGSDVTLNWMEAGIPTAWITHSGQFGNNSIGTDSAANFDVAQRFTAAQLANLGVAGGQLLKVKFVPHEPAATYTVKVWTGGSATGSNYNPGTQVATQVATNITVDAWNTVILDTPVDIPTNGELWIGYNNNTPGGFPAGVDQGPAIDGYGNLLNMDGWGTLLEAGASLNYNWCIEGLATTVDRQIAKIDINSIPVDDAIVPSTRSYTGMFDVTSFETANTMATRDLLGYKVYRDGTLLTTNTLPISTLTYLDADLEDGTYTYGVTAVYDEGESAPATVTVEVNANYAITTFPWDEGFETFLPMGWLNIDADGDGNKWRAMDGADYAHSGTKAAASASYDNATGPLTPDNWLISPKLSFPEGHAGTLKFWVAPQDPNWPTEIYSVMVSTTDTDLASFNPVFNEMIINSDWQEKTVQLPYPGADIYIAFRHHDCSDLFMMKLDDVHVETSVSTDVQPVFTTKLSKNYPNPFNPTTTIAYSVKEAAPVKLEIYNIKGQKVRTLVNDVMAAGNHTVVWNGHDDSGKNVG